MQNRSNGNLVAHVVDQGMRPSVDVFGPTIQFLSETDCPGGDLCVLKGTLHPRDCVPLHSHPDIECFFVVEGELEFLTQSGDGFAWISAGPGTFIEVPGHAKHAFRNLSNKPAVCLVSTTTNLGRFFEAVGRPTYDLPKMPSPEELRHFAKKAAEHRYWLASPEENVAAGVPML
jgi:quercetin dioxygenase-like cupin family protein